MAGGDGEVGAYQGLEELVQCVGEGDVTEPGAARGYGADCREGARGGAVEEVGKRGGPCYFADDILGERSAMGE